MPSNSWRIQSSMNRGEATPLLDGRKDLQLYYDSLSRALNVRSIPQGGVKKREGTRTLAHLDSLVRTQPFSFNTEQNYMLALCDSSLYVFKEGIYQTDIGFPYSAQQIQELVIIQSADTAIFFHRDVATRRLTRTSDTDWTLDLVPFEEIPKHIFPDTDVTTATANIQEITFKLCNSGDSFKISLDELLTEEIAYSEDDENVTADNIANAVQRLSNTGSGGVSCAYTGSGKVYRLTLDEESADDWPLAVIIPVTTKDPAFEANVTEIQAGISVKEYTWSDERGWPTTGVFYGGRLWIGGSRDRPTTIWGSRVSEYYNFKAGRGFDDESIERTLDTDQLNAIVAMVSNRTLQVFTTGQEFHCTDKPITPSNCTFDPQTNVGAKKVQPVVLAGVTLFVNGEGKSIHEAIFSDQEKANTANSITTSAEHLIKDPVNMAIQKGTSSSDAVYLYINNADGSCTVFNSLSSEGIAGFTDLEIAQDDNDASKIIWSSILDNDLYHIVERVLPAGNTVRTLEIQRDNFYLDSSQTVGADPDAGDPHVYVPPRHLHGVHSSPNIAKSAGWPDTNYAGSEGSDTSYELSVDEENRMMYVVNYRFYTGAKGIESIVRINLDNWTVDKYWDLTTTPSVPTHISGDNSAFYAYPFRSKHSGHQLVFHTIDWYNRHIWLFNGRANNGDGEFTRYSFDDYVGDANNSGLTNNTIWSDESGLTLNDGLSNELNEVFYAQVDSTNNRLWILFACAGSGGGRTQWEIGYINISDRGPSYQWNNKFWHNTDTAYGYWRFLAGVANYGYGGVEVLDGKLYLFSSSVSYNGGMERWDTADNHKDASGYYYPEVKAEGGIGSFPLHGVKWPRLIGDSFWGGNVSYVEGNKKGLLEISKGGVCVGHEPSWGGGTDYDMANPQPMGDNQILVGVTDGIGLYNIEESTWQKINKSTVAYLSLLNLDSGFQNTMQYWDAENEMIITGDMGNYSDYRESIGVTIIDGHYFLEDPATEGLEGYLWHLEGLNVSLVSGGYYLGECLVTNGELVDPPDLPDGETEYQVGLLYYPDITTQPVNYNARGGSVAYKKKKITRCALNLYESKGVIANGRRIADKTTGVDVFDIPDVFTGIKRLHLLGWTLEAKMQITQTTPDPLLVRLIALEVTT